MSGTIRPEPDSTEALRLRAVADGPRSKAEGEYLRRVWSDEEQAALQRIADAEAIVRDLAASNPVGEVHVDWDETVAECTQCGSRMPDEADEIEHLDDCAFARSRAWISAHPVSTEPESPAMCKCGHDLGWHSRWNQFDQVVPCDHNGCECEDFDRVSAHPVSETATDG